MKYCTLISLFLTMLYLPSFGINDSSKHTSPQLADSSDIHIQEIIRSKVPVLIDFWAEWCGPCRILSPVISQLKMEYTGKIKVLKINIDRNRKLAYHFKVQSIPAVFMIKNKVVDNYVLGVQPRQAYITMIEKAVNPEPEKPDSTIQKVE